MQKANLCSLALSQGAARNCQALLRPDSCGPAGQHDASSAGPGALPGMRGARGELPCISARARARHPRDSGPYPRRHGGLPCRSPGLLICWLLLSGRKLLRSLPRPQRERVCGVSQFVPSNCSRLAKVGDVAAVQYTVGAHPHASVLCQHLNSAVASSSQRRCCCSRCGHKAPQHPRMHAAQPQRSVLRQRPMSGCARLLWCHSVAAAARALSALLCARAGHSPKRHPV